MDHTREKILGNKSVVQTESSIPDKAGNVVELDNNLLEKIGYRQGSSRSMAPPKYFPLTSCTEFKREFTRLSTLSYAISIMGVLGSVPATYSVPLSSAGPAAAIWCWCK